MKNDNQLKKQLKSDKNLNSPVCIVNYTSSLENALIKSLEEISNSKDSKKILLLGRNRFDINFLKDSDTGLFEIKILRDGTEKIISKLYRDLDITFLTVHRSKGIEGDEVIVLNMKDDLLGFPNKIADDRILNLVLTKSENHLFAEERRLFYVALTRTKNRTFLLTPLQNRSMFIEELLKLNSKNIKEYKLKETNNIDTDLTCPQCKTGILLERNWKNSKFLSCSHYPQCDFTINDLTIKERKTRCPYCGDYLVERSGRYGDFLSCNTRECDFTANIPEKKKIETNFDKEEFPF